MTMTDLNKLTREEFVAWCMATLEKRGFDTQKDPIPPVQVSEDGEGVNFSDEAVKELKKVPAFKQWLKPHEAELKAQRDHHRMKSRMVITYGIDLNITSGVTADNREAQILANIQALGIDTEQYPVIFYPAGPHGHDRRYPIHVDADGRWRIESDALQELTKTPSPLTDWWEQKKDRAMQMIVDGIMEYRGTDVTLARIKGCIADLGIGVSKIPPLAADTQLSVLITQMDGAFQALRDHIEQLTNAKPLNEEHQPYGTSLDMAFRFLRQYLHHLEQAILQDDALSFRDLGDDYEHLQEAFTAIMNRITLLLKVP
jgi:hypothetical protein